MSSPTQRGRRWLPVLLFILAHAFAFALFGWMAHEFSSSRPELSPQGSHLRLVPLGSR
jgi:hypothetical protein